MLKIALATFGYFFQNFGEIFTKSSGHTDQESKLFFYRADVVTSSTRMRTQRRRQLIEFSTRCKDPEKTRRSQVRRLKLIDSSDSLVTRTRKLI